jgi:ribosomal protein S7
MIRGRSRIIEKELLKIIYFRLINRFVRNGKKDFVLRFFFDSLILLKRRLKISFRSILDRFFYKLRPLLQLKPLFSSGIIYQLPSTLSVSKEYSLSVLWFYQAISNRTELNLKDRFYNELFEIYCNKGHSLTLKRDYYKQIVQNRIFLYRFRKRFRI